MRYQSFTEFWPYYIREHSVPSNRHVHFLGTSSFLGILGWCLVQSPTTLGPTLLISLSLIWAAFSMEARRNASPVLFLVIALCAWANPWILLGPVVAYGCAWFGHFRIEHNRPATFTYTLWSLAGDFRMYGNMLRGRLWTGDGSDVVGPVLEPGDLLPKTE